MENKIAEKYGWRFKGVDVSHEYLLPPNLHHLKKNRTKNVLDIGTGNGATIPV
jgi:methylase of polypeptide subunit release factors